MCPVTAILDLRSGISTMSESVTAKLQATVPDVQIVRSMTDDQYVKMAHAKLVLVKHKSFPVRTALHTMWGPVVMDPVSYTVFAGQGGRGDLGEPDSRGSGNYRVWQPWRMHASVTSPSSVWNRRASRNVGG